MAPQARLTSIPVYFIKSEGDSSPTSSSGVHGAIILRLYLTFAGRDQAMGTLNLSTTQNWGNQSSRAAPELLTDRELEAMLKIGVKTIYT
jgi:hypothetical protein